MPITAPSTPEKKSTSNTSSARRSVASAANAKTAARAEAVDGIFQIAGTVLVVTKNYADAGAIAIHKDNISIEVAKVADENEKFAALLDRLTAVGPYAGLLTAVLPLAMQLAANHGRIDPLKAGGLMGVQSPEALVAQVQADLDTKKAEFLTAQKEAQEKANTAQRNLAQVQERAA
jgi:hypothetical protein